MPRYALRSADGPRARGRPGRDGRRRRGPGRRTPSRRQIRIHLAGRRPSCSSTNHMAKPTIDDETAKKWAKNFLKDLDPQKNYFVKADIDEFMARRPRSTTRSSRANLASPRLVFDRFLKRSDERLGRRSLEILDRAARLHRRRVDRRRPRQARLARRRRRGQGPARASGSSSSSSPRRSPRARATRRSRSSRSQYKDRNRFWHQFDTDDLLEIYLTSLTKTFDPHSTYMSQVDFEDLMTSTLHLSLDGIGALLESEDGYPDGQGGRPRMARPTRTAGSSPRTRSSASRSEDGDARSTSSRSGSPTSSADPRRARHQGPPDRPARRTQGEKVYELTRQKIDLAEQHAKGQVIEQGRRRQAAQDRRHQPARPSTATPRPSAEGDADAVSATEDCRKLIEDFKAQGVNAVVVDLREQRRRPAQRGDLALRPVHRQGPGRPGPRRLGRPAPRRRGRGHRLGRPARRPDRPPQRQRLGDLRRRDQGLRPRPDHRRLQHLRQGHGPEHRADQRAAPPRATTPVPTWAP